MNKLGITKIEILIVALVIGLLGMIAVWAVMSARSSARDAIRISDVVQTKAGLELYFNDSSEYPQNTEYIALGQASTQCLGSEGFKGACSGSVGSVYLGLVASTPTDGLDGLVSCDSITNAYCYAGYEDEYRIQFELENDNAVLGLSKGLNCATESKIESGVCASF